MGPHREATSYLPNRLSAKPVPGLGRQPIRWEIVRFTLPNQRIGFHADARYNMDDFRLREADVDIRLIYPQRSVAAGSRGF